MRYQLAAAALAAAGLTATGASATTIFTPTDSGYFVYSSQSASGFDSFSFDTTAPETISGSFSTQALFDGLTEVSGLEITSITFNGADLVPGSGNTATSQVFYLPSTAIAAGTQLLKVVYQVDDALVAPSYSGTLTVSSPVAEPATWAMLGVGFGLVGLGMQKRRARRTDYTQAV